MHGYTLLETLITTVLLSILMLSIGGLVESALQAERHSRQYNDTLQQARFAMQQMLRAVAGSRHLLIPLAENTATTWSESVRDVLAVTLDPTMDRNADGWADANNDKDYLDKNGNGVRDVDEAERIDEDLGKDNTLDNAPGIIGIDDDNDGSIDEGTSVNGIFIDNDEDGVNVEDVLDGVDNDQDGTIDEDMDADMNGDGKSGIVAVDDDLDGAIDEADPSDDDEDGAIDEDGFEALVFFLSGSTLMQRIPNLDPVDGRDYGEYALADNVSQFQVVRSPGGNGTAHLVKIELTLSPPSNDPVTLQATMRVGSAL